MLRRSVNCGFVRDGMGKPGKAGSTWFARAYDKPDTGKLTLTHATRNFSCDAALGVDAPYMPDRFPASH